MKNYKPFEYKKGFALKSGKTVTGIPALTCYTFGFMKYHIKKMMRK